MEDVKKMLFFFITKYERETKSTEVDRRIIAMTKQNLETMAAFYLALQTERYSVKKNWGTRIRTGTYLDLLNEGRESVFKSKIRMSKEAFKDAVRAFGDYEEFENFTKEKIELHFLITFHRLGCKGNAASITQVSDYFGVSGMTKKRSDLL